MSQGFVVPLPQRLFTSAGVPANGWKIQTKVAGTSTNLTTYSDAGLLSANTNPIICDASGYFRCFTAQNVLIKLVVLNESDVQQFVLDNIEAMIPDASSSSVTAMPTGGICMWGTATAPTNFLLCDGSAVSRATYAALFAIVSTTFGAGDGSTTFNLPDFRGHFPFGKATSGTGSTLGGTFGTIDHTHTGPSHTHSTTVPRDGWSQTLNAPSFTGRINTGYASGTGQFNSSYQATADIAVTSAAGGTGATGTGNPPALTVNFIIKT